MNAAARRQEIQALETAFWQSMLDGKAEVATQMLTEPALMVSSHGRLKFDHADYEKMAADDSCKLTGFEFSDFDVVFPTMDVAVASYRVKQSMEAKGESMSEEVFDSSTWVKLGDAWKCVAHTESQLQPRA
jgi:hypothetical protein